MQRIGTKPPPGPTSRHKWGPRQHKWGPQQNTSGTHANTSGAHNNHKWDLHEHKWGPQQTTGWAHEQSQVGPTRLITPVFKCRNSLNCVITREMNSQVLHRHLAITELIDHIRIQIMEMMSKMKIESSTWDSNLCPKVEEQLQTNISDCRGMKCNINTPLIIIEVHDHPSSTINLETCNCSSKEWRVKRKQEV